MEPGENDKDINNGDIITAIKGVMETSWDSQIGFDLLWQLSPNASYATARLLASKDTNRGIAHNTRSGAFKVGLPIFKNITHSSSLSIFRRIKGKMYGEKLSTVVVTSSHCFSTPEMSCTLAGKEVENS